MERTDRPMLPSLVALVVTATLAADCGEPGETISEGERGASEGTVFKLETEGGRGFQAELGERVKLPADFPRDIPVYPGATPQMAIARPREGMVLNLRSQDSRQEVYEFYASELASEGWEIGTEMDLGGQRMLTAVKGERRALLTIAGDGNDTVVTIALTEGRQD
jgi:hypothetical protein